MSIDLLAPEPIEPSAAREAQHIVAIGASAGGFLIAQ